MKTRQSHRIGSWFIHGICLTKVKLPSSLIIGLELCILALLKSQFEWEDGNGNHLDKHWIRRTERCLMKGFPIQDCIIRLVAWLVNLSYLIYP